MGCDPKELDDGASHHSEASPEQYRFRSSDHSTRPEVVDFRYANPPALARHVLLLLPEEPLSL